MTPSPRRRSIGAGFVVVCALHPHEGTMLRGMTLLGIVATILARAASVQGAEEPREPKAGNQGQPVPRSAPESVPRKTSIHAIVGFGAPVGLLGIEVAHVFGSTFEVSTGIGSGQNASVAASRGIAIGNSLQWAVMPRLRVAGDTTTFTVGAGISGGNYAVIRHCGFIVPNEDCTTVFVPEAGYVLWGNLEMGWEIQSPGGFSLRGFVGYGHVLTPGALHCVNSVPNCATSPSEGQDLPYVGLGAGYAF
jgi:hypothetical protein